MLFEKTENLDDLIKYVSQKEEEQEIDLTYPTDTLDTSLQLFTCRELEYIMKYYHDNFNTKVDTKQSMIDQILSVWKDKWIQLKSLPPSNKAIKFIINKYRKAKNRTYSKFVIINRKIELEHNLLPHELITITIYGMLNDIYGKYVYNQSCNLKGGRMPDLHGENKGCSKDEIQIEPYGCCYDMEELALYSRRKNTAIKLNPIEKSLLKDMINGHKNTTLLPGSIMGEWAASVGNKMYENYSNLFRTTFSLFSEDFETCDSDPQYDIAEKRFLKIIDEMKLQRRKSTWGIIRTVFNKASDLVKSGAMLTFEFIKFALRWCMKLVFAVFGWTFDLLKKGFNMGYGLYNLYIHDKASALAYFVLKDPASARVILAGIKSLKNKMCQWVVQHAIYAGTNIKNGLTSVFLNIEHGNELTDNNEGILQSFGNYFGSIYNIATDAGLSNRLVESLLSSENIGGLKTLVNGAFGVATTFIPGGKAIDFVFGQLGGIFIDALVAATKEQIYEQDVIKCLSLIINIANPLDCIPEKISLQKQNQLDDENDKRKQDNQTEEQTEKELEEDIAKEKSGLLSLFY